MANPWGDHSYESTSNNSWTVNYHPPYTEPPYNWQDYTTTDNPLKIDVRTHRSGQYDNPIIGGWRPSSPAYMNCTTRITHASGSRSYDNQYGLTTRRGDIDPYHAATAYVYYGRHRQRGEIYDAFFIPSLNMEARAITECALKLKDQQVNLGENVATAKQTYEMFASKAVLAFQTAIAIKQRNWSRLRSLWNLNNAPKDLASLYLEFIYGWKPFASDIYATHQLFQKQVQRGNDKPLAFRHVREVVEHIQSPPVVTFTSDVSYEVREEWVYSCKCILWTVLSDSFAHTQAQVGISNPGLLAWELLPWSFVVDWVVPIGSALSGADAFAGLDFLGGCTVHKIHSKAHVKEVMVGDWTGSPASLTADFQGYYRKGIYEPPVTLPYMKSPFSNNHSQAALALATQLV